MNLAKNDIMQMTLFPEVKEERTPKRRLATFRPYNNRQIQVNYDILHAYAS